MPRTAKRHSSILLAGLVALASPAAAQGAFDFTVHPIPEQPAMVEGMLDIGGHSLWYTDSGGDGEPVVFLHPASVAGDIWLYQLPALVDEGYRVVSYSRRGFLHSDVGPEDRGTAAGDLAALIDGLGLQTVHLVSAAAGGIYAADYALSHPERVRSLTICCSLISIRDRAYMGESAALRPAGFNDMPASFRELGPAYRAANPEGTAIWSAHAENAVVEAFRQDLISDLTLEALQQLTGPVLLIAGDADLYTPAPMMRRMAEQIPNSEDQLIHDAGHAPFWERPEEFNALLIDFLSRH